MQTSLTLHKQSKNERIKYDRDKCDGRFTQKVHQTNHKKFKHEGIKYEGDLCGGSFAQ